MTKANRLNGLIVVPLSLGGAALLALSSQAQLASTVGTGLKGEYFSNPTLSGTPVLTRVDSRISFLWLTQSPGKNVPADQFSVRWTGQLQAPVTGTYTLSNIADESMRVYLSGKKIIDCTAAGGKNGTATAQVSLVAGQRYNLVVEYTELTGTATAMLNWTCPGGGSDLIPSGCLFPTTDSSNVGSVTPANRPPAVSLLSPASGTGYAPPGKIGLTASATDADGSVAKVEYFAGASKIGEATSAPFAFSWTGVTPGVYSLSAKATDNSGASATSAAVSVKVLAPAAGTADLTVPTNLRIQGTWQASSNSPTDILTWDPVTGADSYNVYQYDVLIARGVRSNSCVVPANYFLAGMSYFVTAVDANGQETIPSNIVSAQGANNPSYAPYYTPTAPTTPNTVTATPQWNAGRPRIHVTWNGTPNANYQDPNSTYNLYRNGVKVATGLWGFNYIDLDVNAGQTYVYQVTGNNVQWTQPRESALSAPAAATALQQGPSLLPTPVTITSVVPNDDSVIVYFSPVSGAKDYRCYQASNPLNRKYSGGGLSIEMNGLNPANGADLVVEAVDKLGPYQKHDGFQGPGEMQHDGSVLMEVNGQGDPSNQPIILARSAKFHVNCQPRQMAGEQVFFDRFRDSQPFVWAEAPQSLLPNANGLVSALQNDKWFLYNVQGDLENSQFFVQGNHFMDTFMDGDKPGGRGPAHNNVASFVMKPKVNADISGGKTLHVTFEVDPHFNSRRWCDVLIADANDPLTVPGKFAEFNQLPTVSGNLFRWEVTHTHHTLQLFGSNNGALARTDLIDLSWGPNNERYGPAQRIRWDGVPLWNGSTQDLDRRHRYDLYLSRAGYQIQEDGVIIKSATFPAGTKLPFSDNLAVYFVHQVYHTSIDRQDGITGSPEDSYWYNYRPWADERHWDNMGFEVLSKLPK